MPLRPGVEAALAVCIAVIGEGVQRTVPVVRTTRLATAYLGAVCDTQLRLIDWVELWFPHDAPDETNPAGAAAGENAALSSRWLDLIQRWERSGSSGFIKVGWEAGLPHPLVLQTDSLSWLQFADPETGRTLQFCRDDGVLAQAGLPTYSGNGAVYLSSDGSRFFQAAGTTVGNGTRRLDELLPKNKPLAVLSAGGRGMAVRRIAPLALGDYADILAGTPLSLEPERQETVRLLLGGNAGGPASEILDGAHRLLMRARAGRNEWVAEIVTLKMRLLCQALQQARREIAISRAPLLSISEHAFAVRFGLAGPPLKLWDFEVSLHATGCAAIRQVAGATLAWRATRESQMPPAYERRSSQRQHDREVECRLRLVVRQELQIVVEATLGRCEETNLGGTLGCLNLPLAVGRRALWGRLSRDDSLARDEIRFRSFPTELDPAATAELERMQGFVWSNVLLGFIPAVGFGDDFHSLGVLAVRLLLTAEPRKLPSALDTVFSVIERLREAPTAGALALQLRAAFDREPRFRELLHPGRAVAFPVSREDAIASLGEGGWWELLAFVVRLFPTELPAAFCRAEAAADLEVFPRAFDEAISAAEALNRRLTDQVMPHEAMNARIRAITDSIRRAGGV